MGRVATDALHVVIEGRIEVDSSLTPHYTRHFSMQSDDFQQPLQSTTFMKAESLEAPERLNTCLHSLEQKLNLNQDFAPDYSFTLDMTFIQTPGPGCGMERNANRSAAARKISKHVVITIENQELCFLRGIVTTP